MRILILLLVATALAGPSLAWGNPLPGTTGKHAEPTKPLASDDAAKTELSASERNGIQAAGQHLLTAKRSYPHDPDPELLQLRSQIDDARQAIMQLVQPDAVVLPPASPIDPGQASAKPEPGGGHGVWRERNAERIGHSRQKLAEIRAGLNARRSPPENGGGWRKQVPADIGARLAAVAQEVEAATALPAEKREKKLRSLSALLEIEHSPFGLRGGVAAVDVPTFGTRTGHRIPPDAKPPLKGRKKGKQP